MSTNTRTRFLLTGIVLGLITMSSALWAGTTHYRWLNERGHPVHSDRPPPKGIDYEVITTGSSLKRVVTAEEGAVPPEVSPRVGNEFEPINELDARRSKKNPELCARARSNLEALSTNTRVTMKNDQGEDRELSPQEIALEREKAQALVGVYCP